MIPYGRQDISDADVQAVVDVLRSDFLTQGPAVPAFERAVMDACGARHAVAVNSGTSALHIACLALGVGPGDLVWTSPTTFVASANCARYCGADVDFVDIDASTWNMSVPTLADKLARARQDGRLPKVVIPVDLTGEPCDLQGIHALSREFGFRVIEDASHAVGARYQGQPVGDGRFSDITVFSFHPVKIVTTAEGGAAVTNDDELADRLRLFRNHGITREPCAMTHASDGPWYYQQIELGFNYRMTELQAALGVSQLTRLEEFIAARQSRAARYDNLLRDVPVTRPLRSPTSRSALHLYVVRLKLEQTDRTHLQVFEALRAAGIGVNLHYIPVYTQPYYERLGFRRGLCPNAEAYYADAISLPMFATLPDSEQDAVVHALASGLGVKAA